MGGLTYTRYHQLVYESRGSANHCVFGCNAEYYYWANLLGDYADPNDYAPMCASCHKSFDNAQEYEFKCGHPKVPQYVRYRIRYERKGKPVHIRCAECTKHK